MATKRILQLLRSNTTYTSFSDAKSHIEALTGHKDGEILLARYISSAEGVTPATYETAIGVYFETQNKWTVFKSSTELDAQIAALQSELDATQTAVLGSNTSSYVAPASGEKGYEILGGDNAPANLKDAIMALADAIAAMDHTKNYTAATTGNDPVAAHATDASKVISGVNQENGVLDTVTTDAVDLLLTGYQNTNASGAIAGTDTLENALSKLENATSAGVKVSEKAGNQIQRIENDSTAANNGLYSHVEIAQLTEQEVTALSDSNVREAYKLINPTDRSAIGGVIKIYKDSALQLVYLGTANDTIDASTGTITEDSSITDKQSLNFKYLLADGTYSLVKLDVSKFLTESEFGDGLDVSNAGVVSVKAGDGLVINSTSKAVDVNPGAGIEISSDAVAVKIDSTSEQNSNTPPADFLTVSANGLKIDGIKDEIDRKIAALDGTADANGQSTTATTPTADFQVLTKVVETDGAIAPASTEAVKLKKVAATGAAADVSYDNSTAQMADSPATVQAAIDKLDSRIDALGTDALESVTSTNGAIVVGTKSNHTQSLTFTLSGQQASTAADAAYAGGDTSNILQIKNDGLYLDNVWDCGVY